MAAQTISANLTYLTEYFYGTTDENGKPLSPDHLKELGKALRDMVQGKDPVTAINEVLPAGVVIDPKDEHDIRKMFAKAIPRDWTGKIQVRETLVYFTSKLGYYLTKGELDVKPPDPWGAL
jgi:hypothetical protein